LRDSEPTHNLVHKAHFRVERPTEQHRHNRDRNDVRQIIDDAERLISPNLFEEAKGNENGKWDQHANIPKEHQKRVDNPVIERGIRFPHHSEEISIVLKPYPLISVFAHRLKGKPERIDINVHPKQQEVDRRPNKTNRHEQPTAFQQILFLGGFM
jgi:hypothetical protein